MSQLILNSTKTPEIKLSIQYGLRQAQLDASALAKGIYILVHRDKAKKGAKAEICEEVV